MYNCFLLHLIAGSNKWGVRIEFVTENSIRKYQVCKPVAPQKTLVDAFYDYGCFPTSFLHLSW